MSLLVGVTGSMGAGKSMVAKMLRELGAHIIDADKICHDLVQPGKPALQEIVESFGEEILQADRSLNRSKLAKIVFADPGKKKVLEQILHPKVFVEEQKLYAEIRASDSKAVVVIDAALLIESGNYRNMDKVVLVRCDEETQIQRLLKRNIWSREEIIKRLQNQMSAEEKIKVTDYLVPNDTSVADLEKHVKTLYAELKAVA